MLDAKEIQQKKLFHDISFLWLITKSKVKPKY